MTISNGEWEKLWNEALASYQHYIAKANDTFQLLSNIEFPVTIEHRMKILEQRKVENGAREELQIARNNLFAALNGSEIRPADIARTAHAGAGAPE